MEGSNLRTFTKNGLGLAIVLPCIAVAMVTTKPAAKPTKVAVPALQAQPASAAAQESDAPGAKSQGPVHVRVATYLLNLGKVDIGTGTYTVDFYLDMMADQDIGDAKFEFMNGRAATVDTLIDKPTEKFYRIQANLATNVDLKRYPWDQHDLPIVLEHATRSKKEIIYEVDDKQSGIDPAVTFVGWDLRGYQAEVRDHLYKVYGEEFSQYVFKVKIARLLLIASLKTFLPVACFLLISLVSLLITLEKMESRVGMNTAMLIASVMFHLSISGQLPPAGYLTVADKVMIATYATIGLNLFLSVMMMRLQQLKEDQLAAKIREWSFSVVPGFAALAYVVVSVT